MRAIVPSPIAGLPQEGRSRSARIVNLSWHRVHAICSRYVKLALASANLPDASTVASQSERAPPAEEAQDSEQDDGTYKSCKQRPDDATAQMYSER
jgi:hypothetical protein